MLAKRIIPCLDIAAGRTVKGVNFCDLKDAGDPVELARRYAEEGADELVFLDITATIERRKTLIPLVEKISSQINIPFTVGGGISSVEDARALLYSGADKIAINSAAFRNPELINELSQEFGSQCIVLAIDAKLDSQTGTETNSQSWLVYLDGGRTCTDTNVLSWAREAVNRGAGEILLTSMDHDGTKGGFALELTRLLSETLPVPVIASGGGGNLQHFSDVFQKANADAALAASIFHYREILIGDLKLELARNGIEVRK